LIDSRGRRKPDTIQTEEEKLKAKISGLKERNDYLETENIALKKLDEIEKELISHESDTRRSSKSLKNYRTKIRNKAIM